MADVQHASLTGSSLHEPKGVDAASANRVYVSDGVGSGAWNKITSSQMTITSDMSPYGPKAWVNFTVSGGVVTIAASYNVASVVHNTTGDYTITFTSALADANYVVSGMVQGSGQTISMKTGVTPSTSAFTIISFNTANSGAIDLPIYHLVVFGN